MTELPVATPHHTLNAYLATPPGAGRWPGVVVVHDMAGLSADTRRHADWFAQHGYLSIAPDLYSWNGKFRCMRSTFRDLRVRRGVAFNDIDAVRATLAAHPNCTGKVGIIGFCMGGGFALYTASGHDFRVSSVNYGFVPDDATAVLKGACPVIGSFGARDSMMKGHAAKLEHALSELGIEHDVKEYPGAGHGFLNDHQVRWLAPIGRLTGFGYNEAAANDARGRILAFFAGQLS